MNNKEIIDKLQAYYLTQDPALIARLCACFMIDMNRLITMADLPERELECLLARIKMHSEDLWDFIRNGPSGDLKLVNVQNAEDICKYQ
jgi:hypothetical protein